MSSGTRRVLGRSSSPLSALCSGGERALRFLGACEGGREVS